MKVLPDLLLALLLQVQFNLQGLPGLQEGLAMLPVGHVVGHDAHGDDAGVDHDVGQELKQTRTSFTSSASLLAPVSTSFTPLSISRRVLVLHPVSHY